MNSSTKFDSAQLKIARSSSFHLKQELVVERCELGVSYHNSARDKIVGRRLAVVGDELMTKKQGSADCRGLKLAFILIFYVGVYAKFASYELKNSSV